MADVPNRAEDSNPDAKRPVLSLICCSRNDDYLGRATWRLQTGLNLTARAVHELGLEDDVEIILTDWGSDEPLQKVLCLTDEAARLLRVLEVPKPVAERYQRDAPFSEVHALNAAARRSRGEYIGRIDQDTVLGRKFLQRFFELHRGERSTGAPIHAVQMLSNRRGVPYRFASTQPPAWVVDRFIQRFGPRLPLAKPLPEHLYYQSYVGIWLIHRDLWFEIGGYDESFIYINWMEADMILRLEPKYPFVNLGRLIDHDIYHLDHIHPFAHWGAKGRVRRENPVRDRDNPPAEVFPNGEDWGLANEDLRLTPYELKPGEAARARESVYRPARASYSGRLVLLAFRLVRDRAVLTSLSLATRLAKRVLSVAPGLEETVASYRNALRGHPFRQWPGVLRDHRMERRARLVHRSSP